MTDTIGYSLNNSLVRLAINRQRVEAQKNKIASLQAKLERSELYRSIEAEKEQLATLVSAGNNDDESIRSAALMQYTRDASKDKTINDHVSIAEYATFEIDEPTTVAWALDHDHREVLQVNKAAIKKIAKVMSVDGVEVGSEPRVRIASDLSDLLVE